MRRIRYTSFGMFSGGKKPLLVPDPGQEVGLISEDGSKRDGFRAVSGPLTLESGEVVIKVATEQEYADARIEGRRPVSLTWPAKGLAIS